MDMDFSDAINKIVSYIQDNPAEPFIVYRDKNGWHCDFTQNQFGESLDWVNDVRESDPLSLIYTSKDFANGSFPYVYDAVLCNRIRGEYNIEKSSGKDTDDIHALTNFIEDNIGEFSHETTDYLTTLDNPLAELFKMCTVNLDTNDDYMTYNENLTDDAIASIERGVKRRLNEKPEITMPDKRNIEGYVELSSLQLAGRLVILAENPDVDHPYMVANCRWDNPLNITEYYDAIVTDDYIEAVGEFVNRQSTFLEQLKAERAESGLPFNTLTVADCIPHAMDGNITGHYIIIKPESLSPEYRTADHQIKLCTGGNGTRPEALGSAVFCTDLYSGEKSRFERWDVAGVYDLEKAPDWVYDKISALMNRKVNKRISEEGVFEYGGHNFKPFRKFERLDGDWNKQMRRMSSDREIGISAYEWQKANYNYPDFIEASGCSEADVFICLENGKLYVPAENELFRYNDPTEKAKTTDKKPSLLGRLNDAKAEAAAQNAGRKDVPNKKNRGDMEVD